MDLRRFGASASGDEPTPFSEQARVLEAEDMRDYAIYSLDPAGNVASWNDGAARMMGYRSEEAIGLHCSVFFPREAVDSGYAAWELDQASTHGFFVDRGWRVRRDGTRFWAHAVITAQRSPDGTLDGFITITRDEMERSARKGRSVRQFTDLFELAPVGVAVFDESGHLLDANQQLGELLGYQQRDFFEMDEQAFLHSSDRDGGLFPTPTGAGGQNVGGPVPHRVLVRSDGEPVMCQVRTMASVREDGSRTWLLAFHDVTAQVRYTEALEFQATHDELTGLPNRRGFEKLLSAALTQADAGNISVLFCDLNGFKRVNDSLGHQAGDELLATVGEKLATSLPSKCAPARFHGDEFVILCFDTEHCGGLDVLTQQVEDLFQMDVWLHRRLVHVSASIGSTSVEDSDTTMAGLMQSAEAAMFEARVRREGRLNGAGSHVRFSSASSDQLALEEALRKAIADEKVELHYQPIVGNDGSVVLAEALLRWTHPQHGQLSPDVVLTVAKRGGLLADLDRHVLTTALGESADWRTSEGRPVPVSVNLAGLRPEYNGFAEEIRTILSQAQANPERLVLEMVETVIADLDAGALESMRELVRSEGVQFAMDDFGRGYSSLARLRVLPVQILKLDSTFVAGLGTDVADLGIARAVAELSRTMGHRCIAEGVENPTQHHLLRAIGVDAYQGYLFSEPLPPTEFRTYLEHSPYPAPRL